MRHKGTGPRLKPVALTLALLLIFGFLPTTAPDVRAADTYTTPNGILTYETNTDGTDTVTVTHCEQTATDVDVADAFGEIAADGYTVTGIGGGDYDYGGKAGAFLNCATLTSISIPDSVTSIGDYAFRGCGSLTSITIPDGVTSIGEATFYGCAALASIDIPVGMTSIGNAAFADCKLLTSINIPSGVTSIGTGVFSRCATLAEVTIPVTSTCKP